MKISEAGLALLKQSEGFSAQVYNDVANWPTVGYGHKLKTGESFPHGVTASQALNLLEADIASAEAAVNRLAPTAMTQGQFDALVDFCYNLGAGSLQTMLGHGWADVTNQIPRWNKAGNDVLDGLVKRRAAEVALFNS